MVATSERVCASSAEDEGISNYPPKMERISGDVGVPKADARNTSRSWPQTSSQLRFCIVDPARRSAVLKQQTPQGTAVVGQLILTVHKVESSVYQPSLTSQRPPISRQLRTPGAEGRVGLRSLQANQEKFVPAFGTRLGRLLTAELLRCGLRLCTLVPTPGPGTTGRSR